MSGNSDDERNPFVAFRRFADEQISSILGGSADAFTSFGDLRKSFEDAHREAWQKFEQAYERSTNPERRQIDDKPSVSRPDEAPRPFVFEMEIPHRGFHGFFPLHHHPHRHMPFLSNPFDDDSDFSLDFFALSPYSPLRLEQHPQLQDSKVNWRHAFEDLLEAETKPRRHLPAGRDVKLSGASTGLDWAVELRKKTLERTHPAQRLQMPWASGLLNDWFPRERFLALSELEDHTEAEMYDRFLGQPSKARNESSDVYDAENVQHEDEKKELDLWYCTHPSRAHHEREAAPPAEQQQSQQKQPRPSILSSMTTTERRMLPDGSVTTRTVLKRRFADGTEETQESTDSTPPSITSSRSLPSSHPDQKATQPTTSNGTSWWNFWSS